MKDLGERFKNMEQTPSDNVWTNIEANLPKKSFPFKTFALTGIGLLVVGALLVFNAPVRKNVESRLAKVEATQKTSKEKFLESKDRTLTLEDNSVKRRVENVEQYSNSSLSKEAETNVSYTIEEKEVKPVEQTKITPVVETKQQETKVQNQVSVNKTPKLIVENNQTVTHKSNKVDNSAEMELVNQGNLYVPNAFTPTESTNNVFKPARRDLTNYEIVIYARNGKKMFSSRSIDNGWDGRINGNVADKGVYVYVIKYTDLEGRNYTQKGSLMLMR